MADENEVMLRGKLLTEFRVVDLKKELKIRSLSQIGSKNQLISRLKQVKMFYELLKTSFLWMHQWCYLSTKNNMIERKVYYA